MPKSTGGNAPTSGSNSSSKRDDKKTASGKPVEQKRPHTDK